MHAYATDTSEREWANANKFAHIKRVNVTLGLYVPSKDATHWLLLTLTHIPYAGSCAFLWANNL